MEAVPCHACIQVFAVYIFGIKVIMLDMCIHIRTYIRIYVYTCYIYIYVHYMYLFRHILGNSSSKINAPQLESNQLVAEPLVIVCNRLQQLISHLEDQYAYSAPGCRVTGWARGLEEVLAFMQF